MRLAVRAKLMLLPALLAAVAAVLLVFSGTVSGQGSVQSPENSAPNPYQTMDGWATLPDGRKWGSTSAVAEAYASRWPKPPHEHWRALSIWMMM